MIIKLNETEQRLCQFLAKKRSIHNDSVGAVATTYGDLDRSHAELNSLGGELAFCKAFNLYPDLEFDCYGTEDAITHQGFRVDVKTTEWKNGKLMVKAIDRDNCDLYALMIGTFPKYTVAGFSSSAELFKESNLDFSLPHPAYTMEQDRLTD